MRTSPDDPHHLPDGHELLRPRALAARWDTSTRTLQRWRALAKGPAWLRIGGSILYRRDDVIAYEEAMRTGGHDGNE